jgi:transcriptional regulator with XRE-family HTH domain
MQRVTGDEIRSRLGRNLKKFRTQKKLSQMALANMAELAHNFVNDIEHSRKWISPATLAKLANVLEVEPHQFFLGETPEENHAVKIVSGYLDNVENAFNKMVGEVRGLYGPDDAGES